ncbi:GNAT family N-acetyltransferase [Streptococcus sp. zg-86]|uniref:GNAT family N-acetyltransferase n=1 Tax=Streptococcus zhangguiae TaxID=2664091 RepID=A0A6I4R7N3_9STRE|nr:MULTISPECIES: GNAT family N-acetyltransferase [unclassified Streptococcus]MTB63483.1 GNAT family N-acetyltransferase [Streptococcus sp. zg-86]MTB89868.1 GNAT family N-acetyltransferase [Streptococcus sp. zg-36]MWV55539.1 GNAT family N-acetyltransferase [Streptococcus sp. zg-70]QTH47728.1 GNAT family N-acetyltransferase [Streptococcus sp. zg-86]
MELRRPTLVDQVTILEMIEEFCQSNSSTDGFLGRENVVYEEWLEANTNAEMGLGLPEGFVPFIQYVSFDENGRALGFLNLRLRLNDKLLQHGGHIGYCIRPSECGKGYAKEQLRLGLIEARSKAISRVLLTCHVDNEASRRTILSQGGQLENQVDGTERYWIDLERE